jgi:hypothetical protein
MEKRKGGWGRDRKSQRHNTFLFALTEHFHRPSLYLTKRRPDFHKCTAKNGAADSQQFSVFTLLSLNDGTSASFYI